ncbi:MAG TPA: DUF3750 domain-containing protein [Oligoflexus sp.]|uniref:DUF3750 domain-containing protein n=1 Tax=Oligoflexus sp. TaxID=1971216 RepID=UPI002D7FEEE6|nr:DUF3750 domain-containing protein [Oligoflexus sp.]HET9236870.1 DUF3750 domain-containing protein [Oligoflexus sp.]
MFRKLARLMLVVLGLVPLPLSAQDWRTADRSSMGLAPSPDAEPEALVQIYAARAFRWRGYFAVHTWVATKEKNAAAYTTYHVTNWGLNRTGSTIAIQEDIPDRRWFGADSDLLYEIKGARAESAIPQIQAAVASYPYHDFYRAWPGPNSNTFVSHIIRSSPDLRFELPPHAIGKDWIGTGDLVGLSETGTGVQFSLFGLLGLTMGLGEGIEVNLLGLSLGVDFLRPALKLPFLGRLGMRDSEAPG